MLSIEIKHWYYVNALINIRLGQIIFLPGKKYKYKIMCFDDLNVFNRLLTRYQVTKEVLVLIKSCS